MTLFPGFHQECLFASSCHCRIKRVWPRWCWKQNVQSKMTFLVLTDGTCFFQFLGLFFLKNIYIFRLQKINKLNINIFLNLWGFLCKGNKCKVISFRFCDLRILYGYPDLSWTVCLLLVNKDNDILIHFHECYS